MNVTTPTPVPTGVVERPEFTTEHLAIDAERATEFVCDELKGLTATDTDEGVKFRTTDGMLVAILADSREAETVEFHYRTAPASETATLKAKRVWRALKPYAAS